MKKRVVRKAKAFLSARKNRRRWLKVIGVMSAVVVFCTVYALILPAVTMETETICGIEEHTHTEECYAPEPIMDLSALSEEERERVDHVIALIDALPDTAEAETAFAAFEEKNDREGWNAWYEQVNSQIFLIRDAFGALSASEQSFVENWEKAVEVNQKVHFLMFDETIAHWSSDDPSALTELSDALSLAHNDGQLNDEDYEILLAQLDTLKPLETLSEEPETQETETSSDVTLSAEEDPLTETESEPIAEGTTELIGEQAVGDNWMKLRDSGWFEEYSYAAEIDPPAENSAPMTYRMMNSAAPVAEEPDDAAAEDAPPSDVQVEERGGTNTSQEGNVSVSKTIQGTEQENVFDITLTVKTSEKIDEIVKEPDMAIVIVMDISNTMRSDFGDTSRYKAAMVAAEAFIDTYLAQSSLGISKIGFVAFNTDAHRIFDMQSITTQAEADNLKNTMRTETGNIITASDYPTSHSRFTNVEAGLKMASDMLGTVGNENKYIIFLSDGFPTTYLNRSTTDDLYDGYDPYTGSGTVGSDGVFYDDVRDIYCDSGTSYSDKAAIRAREMAMTIKGNGTKIFSIGVDVGGQTIQKYIDDFEGQNLSVVDRTSETYEIGDASSKESYENWLKNSIGSGYYYASTDTAGLKAAYDQIFEEIKQIHESSSVADWVANDPMPMSSNALVEFIGFYDHTPQLVFTDLTGEYKEGGENTASFDTEDKEITWDLKRSGFVTTTEGETTFYSYQLKYRVRLENEKTGFVENAEYDTNDTTVLSYVDKEMLNGNLTISDPKKLEFPIPSVKGYLGELEFRKIDSYGHAVSGAKFTLSHDTVTCAHCRGDGTNYVKIPSQTVVSDTNGIVRFSNIPSGHIYNLEETEIPAGYASLGDQYRVTVAYDVVTVAVTAANGGEKEWNSEIINTTSYKLPETGGSGTTLFIAGGFLLMALALLLYRSAARGRRGEKPSAR